MVFGIREACQEANVRVSEKVLGKLSSFVAGVLLLLFSQLLSFTSTNEWSEKKGTFSFLKQEKKLHAAMLKKGQETQEVDIPKWRTHKIHEEALLAAILKLLPATEVALQQGQALLCAIKPFLTLVFEKVQAWSVMQSGNLLPFAKQQFKKHKSL